MGRGSPSSRHEPMGTTLQRLWGQPEQAELPCLLSCVKLAVISVRIVVGEDQPLVREGIVRVLEEGGYEVVGVAGDAPDLIRKARAHKPDVVVTDIQMPPDSTDDGIRAARTIRED